MFGRFFSFLSFIPGLSGFSGLTSGFGSGMGTADELDADGEAAVSFTPGRQIASADTEETPDSRRTRITDRDLVWPGKIETIQISNPEPIAYRFDLTVTDLNPAFYIRRSPRGGAPQREGGILLQPGDQASFEVVFVPPPAGETLKTRTFSFVLTCFDPRRSGDPGEIVQDLPLRWVTLPSERDLHIMTALPVVVTRPWRRAARFAVQLQNKSFLPPEVALTLLRAPTKDVLEREGETVGVIQQSLPARTPGVWQVLLPPSSRPGSYYATVRGAARAAESVSLPLALTRPVLVRYRPWLRMGRDWVFLLGLLVFLIWLAWGVPARKTPIVRVSLAFAGLDRGEVPADSQLRDLNAQMILLDERGHDVEGQPPIPGTPIGNAYEFTGPTHWYGFRWAFGSHIGWNGWSRETQRFRVAIAPAEAEKAAFKRYDLNTLQPDGNPAYDITTVAQPYGPWVTPATFAVPAARGVFVSLRLGDLGALNLRDMHKVSVAYTLDGQEEPPRTFQLLHDASGGLRPLTLDLSDQVPLGTSAEFTVKVTALGLSSYDVQPLEVKRQDKPFMITLAFPKSYPNSAGKPAAGTQTAGTQTAGNQTDRQNSAGKTTGGPSVTGVPPVTPLVPVTPPIKPPIKPLVSGGKPTVAQGPGAGHPIQPPPVRPGTGGPPTLQPIVPATPSTTPPATPDGLVAQPDGTSQINVHWNPVPDAEKYVLYRSGGPASGKAEQDLPASQTSFSDSGLAPGTVYYYRVQAKRGSLYSPQSSRTAVLTRPLTSILATVTLSIKPKGKDIHAGLAFLNVSGQNVYLNKISACADGKIGDDLFRITADGQPVPFSGKKTKRRESPGTRQFLSLAPGESKNMEVVLNHSYRFPAGAHSYSITYAASHDYPARLQSLALQSNEVQLTLDR